jgi:hypothetical protein
MIIDMGSITISNTTELAEITELLFGNKQFVCVNEPTDETIDFTDENIIFI